MDTYLAKTILKPEMVRELHASKNAIYTLVDGWETTETMLSVSGQGHQPVMNKEAG